MRPKIIEASNDNFEHEVLRCREPVLVDFWARWCRPCRLVTPTLSQLAAEYQGRVKVVKVDTDKYGELAERFKIRGLPTVILFDRGRIVHSTLGVRTKDEYRRLLDAALSQDPPQPSGEFPSPVKISAAS